MRAVPRYSTMKPGWTALLAVGVWAVICTTPIRGQDVDRWTVSEKPLIEFGAVEGNSAYMFSSVQTAKFLPDNRIVVADDGESSVRVFSPNGQYQVEMGGEGQGPGEFQFIFGMWIAAPDTIRIWDAELLRVTTYLADGSLVATHRVDPSPPEGPGGVLDIFAGAFSNGDLAFAWTVGQPGRTDNEVRADRVVFGRFTANGKLRYLLGEAEGLYRHRGRPLPFSPFPHATVFRDSLYLTNGVGGKIAVFEPNGEGVARTVEMSVSHVEASEAWRALTTKLRAEGDGDLLSRIPEPQLEYTPAIAGVLIGEQDVLWVKVYDPTSDPVYVDGSPPGLGGEWLVITRDGEIVARVTMPEDVVPLDIQNDRLLGVRRGPLDVPRIVVHSVGR